MRKLRWQFYKQSKTGKDFKLKNQGWSYQNIYIMTFHSSLLPLVYPATILKKLYTSRKFYPNLNAAAPQDPPKYRLKKLSEIEAYLLNKIEIREKLPK